MQMVIYALWMNYYLMDGWIDEINVWIDALCQLFLIYLLFFIIFTLFQGEV